jgi:predicted TIM-barrel fold metal-dependent hydrolase
VNTKASQAGLPSSDTLKGYRIWDAYFTPAHSHPGSDGSSQLLMDVERALPAMNKAQFERACFFPHVGIGTTTDARLEQLLRDRPELVSLPMQRWPGFFMGMIQVNANDIPASIHAVDRWIASGPMVGVYLPGAGPGARPCNDPRLRPLVERVSEAGGAIMVHTWFKTGGKGSEGESTPAELAELAARFPEQKFVCAHAGGEWQRGIRAISQCHNVLIETSGFDSTAGFIEMALRELGAERILFGSHLPSRSLGTELAKILGAEVSEQDKRMMLGENFRSLLRHSNHE